MDKQKYLVGDFVSVNFIGTVETVERTDRGIRYGVKYTFDDGHSEWAAVFEPSVAPVPTGEGKAK